MALNARAKTKNSDYLLFDVFYDDGSRTSNRKIPVAVLAGADEESAVKAFIAEQDRKIAAASGSPRGEVVSICRSSK